MVLWAGRFSKEIDKHVNDFNSSISDEYCQDGFSNETVNTLRTS